jgi:hypothetical protein
MRRASAASVAAGRPAEICYICYEGHCASNPLLAPCSCRGDTKYVHLACLQRWSLNGNDEQLYLRTCNLEGVSSCSVCKSPYKTTSRTLCGRTVSLLARLPPPSISLVVITRHKQDPNLTNLHYQISFSSLMAPATDTGAAAAAAAAAEAAVEAAAAEAAQAQTAGGAGGAQTAGTGAGSSSSSSSSSSGGGGGGRGSSDARLSALRPISIGRSSSQCDVPIKYRTVSSQHAALRYKKGAFLLEDQGSANGTMVFLRAPMELPFGGAPLRVKLGRTVVTLRARREHRLVRMMRALTRCRLLPAPRQLQPQHHGEGRDAEGEITEALRDERRASSQE